MTIDERLERLTARHEALTETVELLVHQQQEFQRKNEEWWGKNQVLMGQVIESIEGLTRVAYSHERRIFDLEGGAGGTLRP